MLVTLSQQFHFDASHQLSHLPADHPCHNLHGHGYTVIVEVTGEVDPKTGFLIDYREIHEIVKPLIDQLDHHHLNEVEGLTLTSTEYIARWLWERIKPKLPILSKISISETPLTKCDYRGE
jgi:6-pyruvoyltetrahydropterin/6-carboxytetrahydropterin synthase